MHAKTIQIRDVPKALYDKLKMVASKEHRSLSQQALQALELGLVLVESGAQRRKKLFAQWHEKETLAWPAELPAPEQLIREDRER